MTFEVPIWISSPAKLKKLGVIQTIVDSVYDGTGNLDDAILNQSILTAHRQYFTPLGYNAIVVNGQVSLVKRFGPVNGLGDLDIPTTPSKPIDWQPLLGQLGEIKNGITELQLQDSVTGHYIVGTVAKHPADPTILLFTVDQDTIPTNSLPSILSIIDPKENAPNSGLPAPAIGQSYLILNDIGNPDNADENQPTAWRNSDTTTTFAHANDIIAWDGIRWAVTFDSQNNSSVQYVTNIYTGIQYKWADGRWVKSWEGYYGEGFWTIVI
jgi:hypothetical protein